MVEQVQHWLVPGARVIWRYSTDRRSELHELVPAVVISLTAKRVRIKLFQAPYAAVLRTVDPKDVSLRDWIAPIDQIWGANDL
ncbi:hypothetical protein E4K72_08225 [Oxalobacteraceae bacterium OM1]|nr:hypothetical protein E4K72_08225 [Oxalobacteraceae bacterium OM1]